jgi:integrase
MAWCEENGAGPLPASEAVLCCYLAAMADSGYRVSTIDRAVAAIVSAHHVAGYDLPRGRAFDAVMSGIRRKIGVAQTQKTPVMADELRAMVESCGCDLTGLRDRAVLLIGWVGAFRRSEIVKLQVGDVVRVRGGLEITLRRSKTDQEGAGRIVGLPFSSDEDICPVRAFDAWMDASGIKLGYIFRSISQWGALSEYGMNACSVADIIKRSAQRIGLDPSRVSGHSLRAGMVTSAAEAGRSLKSIMNQTGHRSERVAMRYIRHADVWSDNAAKGLL